MRQWLISDMMEGVVGFIAMWIKYALLASFTVKRNQNETKSVILFILKKVTDSDSTELHPHPVATPGSPILEFS